MSDMTHEQAKRYRDKKLARTQEVYDACACQFPLRVWRNGHGHGKTVDGKPCPAIEVVERHDAEDREAMVMARGRGP